MSVSSLHCHGSTCFRIGSTLGAFGRPRPRRNQSERTTVECLPSAGVNAPERCFLERRSKAGIVADSFEEMWLKCLFCPKPKRDATLNCVAKFSLTWSTHLVRDWASGGCRLPDREQPRTGTCEWRDPMDLNGHILSRLPPVSTSFRLFEHSFHGSYRQTVTTPLIGLGASFPSFR
jgi:hypothetical protein